MTDFSPANDEQLPSDTLAGGSQSLVRAFGKSDYEQDYWGHYNTVAIDTLPLRLLQEKLIRHEKK